MEHAIIVSLYKNSDSKWKLAENNTLHDYNCAGVWYLRGKVAGTDTWIGLEVAETQCIKDEISSGISIIMNPKDIPENSTKFKRFREWSADDFIGRGEINRYDAKYSQISVKYQVLEFVVLKKEDSVEERYMLEVITAMNEKAKYWYPAPTNRKHCKYSQWDLVKQFEKNGTIRCDSK